MTIIKGILIIFTIILFLFFFILIYMPKNKKKIEKYSNIPFDNK